MQFQALLLAALQRFERRCVLLLLAGQARFKRPNVRLRCANNEAKANGEWEKSGKRRMARARLELQNFVVCLIGRFEIFKCRSNGSIGRGRAGGGLDTWGGYEMGAR
jgi:hypothetical protein